MTTDVSDGGASTELALDLVEIGYVADEVEQRASPDALRVAFESCAPVRRFPPCKGAATPAGPLVVGHGGRACGVARRARLERFRVDVREAESPTWPFPPGGAGLSDPSGRSAVPVGAAPHSPGAPYGGRRARLGCAGVPAASAFGHTWGVA